MARPRKRHSAAFKAKVALEAMKQSKTLAELAGQFGVHPVQISQWKGQLQEGVEAVFERGRASRERDWEREQAGLYEQIGRLQMELEWVKKKAAR